LAAKVWGRGGAQGEIDYRAAAVSLARSIWDHCFNHETYMPLIGDWADPGDEAFALTRPSDFILSGYLLFYYVSFCFQLDNIGRDVDLQKRYDIGRYGTSTNMGKCSECDCKHLPRTACNESSNGTNS
jgi:hypothetical protein